jgi:hypothetical protein
MSLVLLYKQRLLLPWSLEMNRSEPRYVGVDARPFAAGFAIKIAILSLWIVQHRAAAILLTFFDVRSLMGFSAEAYRDALSTFH